METTKRLKGPPVFVAITFLFTIFVIYMSQTNERMMARMPRTQTRNDFVKPNRNKTKLNVIVLTHMSSGSTVVGNMFNLHPDVFYIYEPLHGLRRQLDKTENEWHTLKRSRNDVLRNVFSTLLLDFFTCGFHEERTIKLAFPAGKTRWLRSHNSWYDSSRPLTKDSLRQVCYARKITVTKIMQTRLPRDVGIRELERVCRSDPSTFDCLIVHLVRDPRAVLSSLIRRDFFGGPAIRLLIQKPMSPEGISFLKQKAQTLCSLVSENLNHVNTEWSNWFKNRYILVRYEDAISNMSKAVNNMYKSVGLPMVDTITNWIKGIPWSGRTRARGMILSSTDTTTIDQWRFGLNSSLVSLFEETCESLMKEMGYIFVNGSEQLQHNISKPLRTANIPFLIDLHSEKPSNEE